LESWGKAIIVGIPSTATYRIRREGGHKKVRTVNMQKLKPRHCRDGDGPPDQDQEEPGRDTKGRRIQEEHKSEDENVTEEDVNDNASPDEPQQEETQVQDKEEEQRENKQEQDTKPEHAEREEEQSEDKEDKKNTKRYNLRKRKGRTVYVSASKIFRLDNLRDTDDVIEAMKRGYEVSIRGSFFCRKRRRQQNRKAERKRQST
jgi:Skp family chaperone for outer membrane proteins